MSKQERAAIYLEYLQSEGFRPEIDKDGDVRFGYEGKVFFIIIDESDPQFFRIVMPNFWKIDNDDECGRALSAISHSNGLSKVAKCFLVRGNVWASIELFFGEPEQEFRAVFPRTMTALMNGVNNFVARMRQPAVMAS